jgi:hypothetical protein
MSNNNTKRRNEIIGEALQYAAMGWRVIPLHGVKEDGGCTCKRGNKCASPGKHPRLPEWNIHATDDEDTLIDLFEKWPNSNLGVKLGDESQIVDFECDTPEAEEVIQELFGSENLYTPTFRSRSGLHRLFRWSIELPNQAHARYKGIDFKIGNNSKGTQSVFPPSKHASGVSYEWLPGLSPDEVEPMTIPESVIVKVNNLLGMGDDSGNGERKARSPEHWEQVSQGVSDGGRNNSMTSLVGGHLRDLRDVDDRNALARVWEIVRLANATYKPPLDDDELRGILDSVLRKEKDRRLQEELGGQLPGCTAADVTEAQAGDPSDDREAVLKLTIVREDPRVFELRSPLFAHAEEGCVRMSAAQFDSFTSVRRCVLEQAEYRLPKALGKRWDELSQRLVDTAERVEGPDISKQIVTVAEYLLGQVESVPEVSRDDLEEEHFYRPVRFEDGSVWLRWNHIWLDAYGVKLCTHADVQRLRRKLGIVDSGSTRRINGRAIRFTVLDREKVNRLREIAEVV